VPGFKKNVNRATTQVMMKTGHVEKTNDRDYEVEERYESRVARIGPHLTTPTGGIEQWRPPQCDCRRRQKDTWTL